LREKFEVFGMSEIRKHYFLCEYCIIAEERAKRPSDFAGASWDSEKNGSENCVFCGGNEEKTPPATAVYQNGEIFSDTGEKRVRNWDFRCFPNLYPALSPSSTLPESCGKNPELIPGFGFHEVIVESPVHGKKLEDFSDAEISGLMKVYRDRVCHYAAHEKISYVSLFKNSGKAAGASLDHPHSQLIALPVYPQIMERELTSIRDEQKCPYCIILEKERASQRLIFENGGFIAFAPYYSTVPFEVWILPKKHISFLGGLDSGLLFDLGEILRDVLGSYAKVLGNLPYNCMFYQLFETPEYHLNIRLMPRLSTAAGFELNTGIYINTVSPEKAASYLKGNE
jgi:UDPglucose--hexose-1-phosphate uridylyltransferase